MSVASPPISITFTSKGQVVIPLRVRKEFHIEEGTQAIVVSTPEGILLKPVTAALVRSGRGIIKRKAGDKPLAEWWSEYKKEETNLETKRGR